MYNPIYESVKVLATEEPGSTSYTKESSKILSVLEDANSPVTRKYQEKMYKAVMNKAHIDFGDIPKSQGNIRNYSGYNTMIDTLDAIKSLALEAHSKDALACVAIVTKALDTIADLSSTYQKGFTTKTEYVALEYNTYVYFCVEATTALIYSFIDVMKDPETRGYQIKLKDTKLRADAFYFEQLKKFNAAQDKLGIEYRKMLESLCEKGKNNMIGIAEVIGGGTIAAASLAIIPISREILYQIYKFRGKISENLEVQAHFLELNKTVIENNDLMDEAKKKKVEDKQANLSKSMLKLSDAIRVKSSKSIMDSKRELASDNKRMSIDSLRDEVSNSPFEIL